VPIARVIYIEPDIYQARTAAGDATPTAPSVSA
jgi:hypothetical protein